MTATRPQDHKSPAKEPFEVEIGGKKFLLPSPSGRTMRANRRRDPIDYMYSIFEESALDVQRDDKGALVRDRDGLVFSPFLAAFDDLDMAAQLVIWTDWMGHNGGEGNSSSSST